MPSISEMFAVISDAITSFATTLGKAMTSVTALFYTPGVDGATGQFTFLGILTLVALGAGLVYLAFNIIRGLIRHVRG